MVYVNASITWYRTLSLSARCARAGLWKACIHQGFSTNVGEIIAFLACNIGARQQSPLRPCRATSKDNHMFSCQATSKEDHLFFAANSSACFETNRRPVYLQSTGVGSLQWQNKLAPVSLGRSWRRGASTQLVQGPPAHHELSLMY